MTAANIIIQKFIDNFNYTNKSYWNEKRINDGYFSHHFFNNQLTSELEEEAQRLHQNLIGIIRHELSENKKLSDFIWCINRASESVSSLRMKYGKQDSEYKPAGYEWILTKEVYSIPIKPGKFEAEMVKGLNAIKDDISDCHKQTINELIKNLSTYDSTRKFFYHDYVRNPSYQEKQRHDRGRKRNWI